MPSSSASATRYSPGARADVELNQTSSSQEFDVTWQENEVEMRLNIHLAADDDHWWVEGIKTYDGEPGDNDWIVYTDPSDLRDVTRTPRGRALEIDLVTDGAERDPDGQVPLDGFLTIDGLRLSAFIPGTGPAPLTGCTRIERPRGSEEVSGAGVRWDPLTKASRSTGRASRR
jgi:hypothetical protein